MRDSARVSAAGANGDGLSTSVLPVASAGASFNIARVTGVFHGTTATATPRGTFSTLMKLCSSSYCSGRQNSSTRLSVCCRIPVPWAKSARASQRADADDECHPTQHLLYMSGCRANT